MAGLATFRLLAVLLAVGAAASGCAPYMKDFHSKAPPEPRADVVQVTHDIYFRQDDQYLSDANARVVDEFMTMVGFDARQDRVVVLDRDGRSAWSVQRTESVRAHLARRNVVAEAGIGGPQTLGYPEVVTIVVERYVLPVLDCPDWTQPRGGNPTNATHRNFGCAEAFNVQQMVANKRDLVVGRARADSEGDIQSLQIRRYQSDVLPPGAPYAKPITPPVSTQAIQ